MPKFIFYAKPIANVDEEGYIFFIDRAKDLIIRGGENIYPVEVEDILRKHPKVQDAAVIGYLHPRLVEIVMAVIQTKEGVTMSNEEVMDYCKALGLAKFKWPEKIVFTKSHGTPPEKSKSRN